MPVADPFETYLKRAESLFDSGDIVQAGQIWQAILKKKPDHETARAGLYKVKLYFDARATQGGLTTAKPAEPPPSDARSTLGSQAKGQDPELSRLLEQGCTLYDAGHPQDAIARWEQVLARDPGNSLALGYINGARRALLVAREDEPVLAEPAPPQVAPQAEVPPPAPIMVVKEPEPDVDVERLLRDGCTLFDMGQVEDALKKWEQILAFDPGHALARAYVQDARKDLGLTPLEEGARPVVAAVPESPAPAPAVTGETDERFEHLIRDGVQLYDMGMVPEAMQKWQQVLTLCPGHAEATDYLAMAKRDMQSLPPTVPASPRPVPAPVPVAQDVMASRPRNIQAPPAAPAPVTTSAPLLELDFGDPEAQTMVVQPPTQPVTPPPAVVAQGQKPRKGLSLPEGLQKITIPGWVTSPAFILGTITVVVIVAVGGYYYAQHRKDQALRQMVASFRSTATAPVERSSAIKPLGESQEDIRRQAQSAMEVDALTAYYRAQELVRLAPSDAAAVLLLERAKAGLGKGDLVPATPADLDKQMQEGNLESAKQSMAYLLNQTPDDPALKAKAGRVHALLAQGYAFREDWAGAEEHLRMGRAMFPADATWLAKLELLGKLSSMSKKDRSRWVHLLG